MTPTIAFFLILSVLYHVPQTSAASDVAWGEPVNGLRIGIKATAIQIASDKRPTFHVTGNFTTAKTDYFIGEPIYAHFAIKNEGREPLRFSAGSDYRATGRPDRFSLIDRRLAYPGL